MKVLQVNCVYRKGSTGKLVFDLHEELQAAGIDSVICYGRGKRAREPNVYKTSSEVAAKVNALWARISGIQYGGSLLATRRLLRIIDRERPDVVHLHCLNGYFVNIYRLLDHLKRQKIRTVLTLHAEFMFTGNCGYAHSCERWREGCGSCPRLWDATRSYWFDRTHEAWLRMEEAFEGFEQLRIVSVSPWLEDRVAGSPILRDKEHAVVLNGIDTDNVFYPRRTSALRTKLGVGDRQVILHVTANFTSQVKGGRYVKELAERLSGEDAVIVVVGGSLGDRAALPANVIGVGFVTDQSELAEYYSMADVTVLTSERETFSMICAESLACGTPVVGFRAGGPESIALADASDFVPYGDIDALEVAVRRHLTPEFVVDGVAISAAARERYSRQRMFADYREEYERLL